MPETCMNCGHTGRYEVRRDPKTGEMAAIELYRSKDSDEAQRILLKKYSVIVSPKEAVDYFMKHARDAANDNW